MSQQRQLEEEEGFSGEAVVLDAEPDVATAVAEDGANDHGLGRAGRGGGDGGGGRRRLGILVVFLGNGCLLGFCWGVLWVIVS